MRVAPFAAGACIASLALVASATEASAQLSPDADWRTIRSEHFRVHFIPELESLARRAAASAELAYEQLSRELVPPRGTVDLVISDDADFSNGWATPFPTNRIVVYAHPPAEGESLRFYHDWLALVITHELTHIFHLDRTRGWWRVAQWVFGRNPFLFPNQYQPRWVTEGLAVYYESRLTGFGRLAGTEHRSLARATLLAGSAPRLDELSLATPRFPGGQIAYAYGSLLFDHLGDTRGPESVARYVERSSGAVIPFFLDRTARRSFGISFTDAWRQWRDSAGAALSPVDEPLDDWRELTHEGRFALHPRWLDDTTLVYAASTGRESPGAYRLTLDGDAVRLGRRNSVDPNVPLPDGGLLFSQPELVSPYVVRSDLYVQRDGRTERLTRGARLAFPDARADGAIVAIRAGLGTTQIVRLGSDLEVRALTVAHPDTQWGAPRWSPDGTRLAAVRWMRGGVSEIVVLDTVGRVRTVIARNNAVNATPSWTSDGAAIIYSSDRAGATDLYIAPVDAAVDDVRSIPSYAPGTRRLSQVATLLLQPEVSPDGDTIAAVYFRADGYHVGVAELAEGSPLAPATADTARGVVLPAASVATPSTRYSPWRSLVPRYWLPTLLDVADERLLLGVLTGANDLVDRHSYTAQAMGSSDGEQYSAELSWRYAGLGQPVVEVGLARWRDPPFLFRGSRTWEAEDQASLTFGASRPRFRSFTFAQVGAELERFTIHTDSSTLLDELGIPATSYRRGIFAAAGWSTTQRPALSISPEDGVAISTYALRRWTGGESGRAAMTYLATASAYKSLDLPGFAHHVIAIRGAAGWTDHTTFSRFSIGGTSGSSVTIGPGVFLGDSRRMFGVRGFPIVDSIDVGGARVEWRGIRALAGAIEYRAPLFMPARGWRTLPLFFDRASLAVFTEAATTWCPATTAASVCPEQGIPRTWLASAGAELHLNAAVLSYDFPYRFRVGVAAPYIGREHAEAEVTVYLTLGLAF